MTQEELAHRIGKSQAWLSHAENTGRNLLRADHLKKSAEILVLNPQQLLRDAAENDHVIAALRKEPLLDDEARDALIVLYRRSLQTAQD
jgi:transcriptional regulator with XRE-family HTH domain